MSKLQVDHTELDNKLKRIIVEITVDHDTDTLEEVLDEYVILIKQAILDKYVLKSEVEAAIGSRNTEGGFYNPETANARNAFRAEIRERLKLNG